MLPLRRLCPLAVLLLVGCASAPINKLETQLAEIDKAQFVVILFEQSEVKVDDADVGNAGGSLIGALIEAGMASAMTKNRQKAIAPLRDTLLEFG